MVGCALVFETGETLRTDARTRGGELGSTGQFEV